MSQEDTANAEPVTPSHAPPLWPMPPHMQQGPPDGPWIPGAYQPGPPPRRRHRVRTVLLWAGGAFAGLVILGVVASAVSPAPQPARPALAPSSAPLVSASSGQAAVPGAAPSPSASFNAAAVTVAGCRDLAAWENGNSQVPFNRDPQSRVIIDESAGTQFASDLGTWVADLNLADPQSALADSHAIARDCRAVGVHTGLE